MLQQFIERAQRIGGSDLYGGSALCWYCGVRLGVTEDHFRPKSKGGRSSRENLMPACPHCNALKGGGLIFEFASTMVLRFGDHATVVSPEQASRMSRNSKRGRKIAASLTPRDPFALLNAHKKCPACGAVTRQVHRWNGDETRLLIIEECTAQPGVLGHEFRLF